MQDRDVVAAVVAGERDGIAEVYDRYAASLYAYCHSMLPKPEAAEVVQDTFLIAVLRLDGLRDPDRLDAWLHAVARNECLRRLGPAGVATAAALVSCSADPGELPAVTLPTELRGQVLTACADNSPTGRAHRVSVTHRAGAFGPSGFPKAIGPAWPRWWRRVQRHPGLMAAVAVMAAVATAAGITVIMTASGSQRTQASALGLGGGVSGAPSSATPGRVSATPSPTRKATPTASPATPSVTMRADTPSPVPPSVTMMKEPSASPSRSSAAPSPSPSPSTSTSPAQGHLLAGRAKLVLTSTKGKAASGLFMLTTAGGPVSHYTIKVPVAMADKVAVSPSHGSLPANRHVAVTVTVTSTVALNTHVTVDPGNLTIKVVLKIKA
jgi:Sigma-70 region 2